MSARRAPAGSEWSTCRRCRVLDGDGLVLLSIQLRSVAQKLDQQLTQRNGVRTVTGLASMLAHEIKNPLFGIRGAAQLLEAEPLRPTTAPSRSLSRTRRTAFATSSIRWRFSPTTGRCGASR